MPLIELLNTTKLRSLGFGHDQPHGGSSPQPYIQTQIPTKKELDRPSPDFLLRGATNADPFLSTGKDLERIGKWFFQEPVKGTLFIAKQNLLSRTAAATDVSSLKLSGGLNGGIYLPTSTLFQVGVSAFGLHVNKQGLNPIPTDPGAGFLQSLLSVGSQPLYGITAWQLDSNTPSSTQEIDLNESNITAFGAIVNRLGFSVGKKLDIPFFGNKKGITVSFNSVTNFLLKLYAGRILDATNVNDVYSYSGGPGSILGLGNTSIKFATNAGGIPVRTNLTSIDGLSDVNQDGFQKGGAITYTQRDIQLLGTPYFIISNGRIIGNTEYSDFRTVLRSKMARLNISHPDVNVSDYRWLLDGGNYSYENKIENRTLIGDPGKLNKLKSEQDTDNQSSKGDTLNSLYPIIPVNSLLTYKNIGSKDDVRNKYDKDLVTFRIDILNNDLQDRNWFTGAYDKANEPIYETSNFSPGSEGIDTILYFRAFLDSITDTYSADWEPIQYVGRGDKFYHYKGFDRQISLGWTVAAQSKRELMAMYERLNYLATVCAPDYSAAGYMRGKLARLTIGGYMYEIIGIIKGFSYEIREEYPWEIAINEDEGDISQLPQVIKVNGFQFIPFIQSINKPTFINKHTKFKNPKPKPTEFGSSDNDYASMVDDTTSLNPNTPQNIYNEYQIRKRFGVTEELPSTGPLYEQEKAKAYGELEVYTNSNKIIVGNNESSNTNNPSYSAEEEFSKKFIKKLWKKY